MKKICFVFVLCGLVSCFVANAYSDTPYILLNIDAPGAVETLALDINNHGKIVGYYEDSARYIFSLIRDGEVVVPFGYSGAEYTWAMGINDADWIAGFCYDINSGYGNFLHNGSDFVPFDPPCGGSAGYVYDINNYNWMVGYCGDGDKGFMMSGANYAFFEFPDADTYAFGMNDNYLIVGSDNYTGFFGTVTGGFYPFEVSGASQTWAYGVNNFGQIVGTYKYGPWYGYVRETRGKIATIHMPNSTDTTVYGINELRQLVGAYSDSSGIWHAFVAIPVANPLPADLIVSEIFIDPSFPDPGEEVDVYVTVKNQGVYDAVGFFLAWYADESAAPAPPPIGNPREYVPYLAAGAEYTMTTTWTYATSGVYQMYGYADTGYGVYESNENNNVAGPVQIVVDNCKCNFNEDGDVDGQDLIDFSKNENGITLKNLAEEFGRIDCD